MQYSVIFGNSNKSLDSVWFNRNSRINKDVYNCQWYPLLWSLSFLLFIALLANTALKLNLPQPVLWTQSLNLLYHTLARNCIEIQWSFTHVNYKSFFKFKLFPSHVDILKWLQLLPVLTVHILLDFSIVLTSLAQVEPMISVDRWPHYVWSHGWLLLLHILLSSYLKLKKKKLNK